MTPIIASLIPMLGDIFDRVFPDPAAAADAKVKVMEMAQRGELAQLEADVKLATGQLEINKVEAEKGFSWRNAVGWTCALSFAFKFVGGPMLVLIASFYGHDKKLPQFDYSEMSTILFGMLGLGTMRTVERIKGAAK